MFVRVVVFPPRLDLLVDLETDEELEAQLTAAESLRIRTHIQRTQLLVGFFAAFPTAAAYTAPCLSYRLQHGRCRREALMALVHNDLLLEGAIDLAFEESAAWTIAR